MATAFAISKTLIAIMTALLMLSNNKTIQTAIAMATGFAIFKIPTAITMALPMLLKQVALILTTMALSMALPILTATG